jgi:hypothetical protein
MPQPTQTDVHVDRPLTNVSVAYIQSQDGFVASKVFPMVPVAKQTDKYFTYTKNDWFRDEAKIRADAVESAGSGYGVGTAAYSCDVFAFHKDVGAQVRANSDSPLDPDADAARFVTQRLLLRKEIQWVSDCFGTSIWGTDATPANLWDNYATSDPFADIETGKRTVLLNTGFEPNTLVLGYDVWRFLKQHPDLLDRLGIGGSVTEVRRITPQILAAALEVDNVYIAKAVKATNVEAETAAYAFTHGKNALLCYVNPNPGLLAPSAGYTFAWTGFNGMGAEIAISRFYLDAKKCDRIEGEAAWDNKVVATDLGYFFSAVVS